MSSIKKKWDSLDKNVQKWAARLGAVATIVGVLVAGGSCIVSQLDNAVAAKIDNQTAAVQQEVQKLTDKVTEQDAQQDLQLTRLELMALMDSNPYNIVEIEKVARHYFHDLGGDWYMSELYSNWAKTYGGNPEIVVK